MNSIDIGLIVMYLMVGVAAVIAIVLPLIGLFSNPKALVRVGIGVVALLLVFFLAYSMSDSTLTTKWVAQEQTPGDIKLIGAGLWMLYIFLFGSLLAMIYSEVAKLFK
jgi:hypothetical protein